MLVLTRKVGEHVVVNENIRVAIHRIQGSRVRISIDAPEDVAILRSEIDCSHPAADEESCREWATEGRLCTAS